MPDKSTTSDAPSAKTNPAEPNAAQETSAVARKIYPIVKYGDPILEKPSNTITKFDAELAELAEDMFTTMYAAQGIGLAAHGVGGRVRGFGWPVRRAGGRNSSHGSRLDARSSLRG